MDANEIRARLEDLTLAGEQNLKTIEVLVQTIRLQQKKITQLSRELDEKFALN